MTAPADRHRVLRAALTAAIRLTGIVSRGHTAALTAAVWRVIEPALAQRDAQLDAVRALHVRNANTGDCEHCSERDYPDYAVPWPCPTIRALDTKHQSAESDAEKEYEALKARFLEAVARGDQPTILEPDPAREAHAVVGAVTREQLHDAIRTLARRDPAWWNQEINRLARITGQARYVGGHQ